MIQATQDMGKMGKSKILVTGAGGFIGSHLAERLVELGHEVRALVRYNSRNFWGWLEESPYRDEMEIVVGDVREYDSVKRAVAGRDVIYHLAALIGIPYSYESPLAYIRINIEGTYNVLEAARTVDAGSVVITSTSEVYGTARYVPIDESHPRMAQSPYAATKIAADELALSFYRSFGTRVKVARPFNTYGPRQSARAIIPTIITQILSGKQSLKLGNLSPTRDLTFVKDTVDAFITVASSDDSTGEVTNIGMGEEISVGDLVSMIARLMGSSVSVETEEARVRPGASEVERLLCDNSKLTARGGWRPLYTLEAGLRETIEWMTSHRRHYKADTYNV